MPTPGLDLAFITVDDNKVTTDLERIKAWSLLIQTTYETAALPANPVDGQEVYFAADATNGVIWHLRYRAAASGSYKWEFLGGPPLEAQTGTTVRTTASTSYVAPATDPMSVTLPPLAGDFDITIMGDIYIGTAGLYGAHLSYGLGGTTTSSDNWAVITSIAVVASSGSKTHRHTGLAANTVIGEYIRATNAASSCNVLHRRLLITPVRVG